MFKEIVMFLHRQGREFCIMRPGVVPRGDLCRPCVKNGRLANLFFFIAIFTPLYVCLLKDVFKLLGDFDKKSDMSQAKC